jgi:hypothetical protein
MSDEWEIYFQEELYCCTPQEDPKEALKQFLRSKQSDNNCTYTLPLSIDLRGFDPELDEDEWTTFEIFDLRPSSPKVTQWFDVHFTVPEPYLIADQAGDDLLDKFYDAGCDDATFIIGGGAGRICAMFAREAENIADAIFTALKDLQRAVPDLTLVSITPTEEPPALAA